MAKLSYEKDFFIFKKFYEKSLMLGSDKKNPVLKIFQTNILAKSITSLVWKFRPIIFIFLLSMQNASNLLLFTHCCCYSKELTYLNCDLMHNPVLASQSVKWFCLGRKSKIPIFKSPYRCFTIIQTSFQIRDAFTAYSFLVYHS